MKVKKNFRFRSFLANVAHILRNRYFRLLGYDMHPTVILERNLNLDRLYPKGIHIGENTLIASGVAILSHDHCKRVDNLPLFSDVHIGKRCFIAVGATILPGVHIGDEVIVGAGSVVTKDVPPNVIVAGNPAKIIRENIKMSDIAAMEN